MERTNPGKQPILWAVVLLASWLARPTEAQHPPLIMGEQRRILARDPSAFPPFRGPRLPTPPTVRTGALPVRELSLDEAIRIALQNTDAVRVLSGVGAASTGLTIYSPAISNTAIDQARAQFDPTITARNDFFRLENPLARFSPIDPNRAILDGSRSDFYDFELNVNKRMLSGGDAGMRVGVNRTRLKPGIFPLNPQASSDVEFSLRQPLLEGRGEAVNSVPIVLALLDTEQSYFRLKNALQSTVLGVIQGYWDLVQARTERWVLDQQIEQTRFAYDRAAASKAAGRANLGEVAQTRASLETFRANLVGAEAAVLDRVASLRGILGWPPSGDFTIVPTTPPTTQAMQFDWNALLDLAAERRPELIELKLVLEADEQRILLSRNQAQPTLDAFALYRWNGLEGEMPIGDRLRAPGGQFTDWTLGVSFSVPLTLRAARAGLRQNELLLANDRTNLEQGLLEVTHDLAFSLRALDQLYAQYLAFREARAASTENLELQFATYAENITTYLDVLLAINTWGNNLTAEARSATQYNSGLANLEFVTGTILETHGVRLFEERYAALGPLGRLGKRREYPAAVRPAENAPNYQDSDRPSEESFDLTAPVRYSSTERLPPVEP